MKTLSRIGFWSGLLAFLATISFVAVQLLQVLRILPFPIDEILIYGLSFCIVIPFVIEILSLHYVMPESKRFWTHGALLFTIMYAIFVSANYVVQLATVIPMKLKGLGDEIRLLDQTPHSLFWNFDALGYIFMGLAMMMAIPAFEKKGFQKNVRWALLANGLMTPIISIVYFYPTYSENLLMLGLPWAITAPLAMLVLALFFRRKENASA
jgi:hypothetical protein